MLINQSINQCRHGGGDGRLQKQQARKWSRGLSTAAVSEGGEEPVERDVMEYDVVTIGAGPAVCSYLCIESNRVESGSTR